MTKFNLADLKTKNLPHLQASAVLAIKEAGPEAEKDMAAAAEYFSSFVPPGPCIGCGSKLGASGDRAEAVIDAMLGRCSFRWGLAHGEGFCSKCGYPARAHHELPGFGRIHNYILQYHPDALEEPKPDELDA